ncbi:MAG TPA: hypothetical protein VNL92_00715 [Dehalococcoidia bacterium]|nr:hypothetical protein [Dehalococcoidia bacterium]
MSQRNGEGPPVVTVSEEAARRIRESLGQHPESIVLRIAFHIRDEQPVHAIMPEPGPKQNDLVFVQHGLKFVVDLGTLPLIRGSHIYWDPELQGIEVDNPNIEVAEEDEDLR